MANIDSNETLSAGAWFRQQYYGNDPNQAGGLEDVKRDPHIDAPIEYTDVKPGETHSDSVKSMDVEFWLGRLIEPGETRWYDAHTHLQVTSSPTDDWEADTGVHSFTDEDNPQP